MLRRAGHITLLALTMFVGTVACRAGSGGVSPDATPIPVTERQSSTRDRPTATPPGLEQALAAVLREQEGTYGVVIEHHSTNTRLEYNARRIFPAASVYKLALAVEVLLDVDGGRLALDDRLIIEEDDAVEPEPAGGPGPGDELTIRETLEALMSVSSNSAGHALLRELGRSRFNADLAALGLRATRVPVQSGDEWAVTTPTDMAYLLRLVAREQILGDTSRAELRRLLALREAIDPLVDAVPPGTTVLSKVGNLERTSNVAGLIVTPSGPLTVSVFDEDVDPDEARQTIAELARTAFAFYAR